MAVKRTRSTHLPLPGKQWFYRASLLLMIVFGSMLFIMSKTNSPFAGKIRTHISDAVAPVLAVASSPMDAVHNAGVWLWSVAHLYEENVALKNEKLELLKWQANAKDMEAENQSLRALLNVVPSQEASFVTARIVSDLGGPYVRSALINGGSENGIAKDEAVISEHGLVGRIVEVGQTSARVLLLGDMNSRVPVISENAHEKSILVGNNTDTPILSYLPTGSTIKVGDRIVTSGDGGVFPKGLPVGIVTSTDGGIVKVQPFVDASTIEYISVVDYTF